MGFVVGTPRGLARLGRIAAVSMVSAALWFAPPLPTEGAGNMTQDNHSQPRKKLPIPGEVFDVEGRVAFLILPERRDPGRPMPWVWYAPTLKPYPGREEMWMFERFLTNGLAIAGIDIGESHGNPRGREAYTAFYKLMVAKRGLSEQACLLARSRGGLMLYNWAVEHPEAVACIAGIYPVCNLACYPGLERACSDYGMSKQELADALPNHNPIDRLLPLARAQVPIFHIHGDADRVVPLEANSGELAKRYTEMDGKVTLEIIEGGGHDASRHWFESQALVDFVVKHAERR